MGQVLVNGVRLTGYFAIRMDMVGQRTCFYSLWLHWKANDAWNPIAGQGSICGQRNRVNVSGRWPFVGTIALVRNGWDEIPDSLVICLWHWPHSTWNNSCHLEHLAASAAWAKKNYHRREEITSLHFKWLTWWAWSIQSFLSGETTHKGDSFRSTRRKEMTVQKWNSCQASSIAFIWKCNL